MIGTHFAHKPETFCIRTVKFRKIRGNTQKKAQKDQKIHTFKLEMEDEFETKLSQPRSEIASFIRTYVEEM